MDMPLTRHSLLLEMSNTMSSSLTNSMPTRRLLRSLLNKAKRCGDELVIRCYYAFRNGAIDFLLEGEISGQDSVEQVGEDQHPATAAFSFGSAQPLARPEAAG